MDGGDIYTKKRNLNTSIQKDLLLKLHLKHCIKCILNNAFVMFEGRSEGGGGCGSKVNSKI